MYTKHFTVCLLCSVFTCAGVMVLILGKMSNFKYNLLKEFSKI